MVEGAAEDREGTGDVGWTCLVTEAAEDEGARADLVGTGDVGLTCLATEAAEDAWTIKEAGDEEAGRQQW